MSKANGEKSGGRKKGTPNKTTQLAKDAIVMAAEKLGGVDRLVEWVEEDTQNERVFWAQIYTKLIPVQIEGNLKHEHNIDGAGKAILDVLSSRASRK